MVKRIIILGTPGSGKTTALKHINNSENTDISLFDYEKVTIGEETSYLFSSPDIEGFKFIQDILTKDIDGIIVVIDNTKGIQQTDSEIINFMDEKQIPYIIFANKQDLSCHILNIDFDVIVTPTIATEGIGVKDGLKMLLKLIENTKRDMKPKRKFKDIINDINSSKSMKDVKKQDFRSIVKKIKPTHEKNIEKANMCRLRIFMHPIELENVKNALEKAGFANITIVEVSYMDKHPIKEIYRGNNHNNILPPRAQINMIIKREDVKYVIRAIESIKTEDILDEIFISPVENAIRVRTGEKGEEAVE